MDAIPTQSNADKLQMMLRQVRDAFLEEMGERLDKLDNLLLAMEKQGAASEEGFNELYRGIHSLKGSGGTHGLHIMSAICHQFEDQLNTVAGNLSALPTGFVDSGLVYISLLRDVAAQARSGRETFPEIERRLAELHGTAFAAEYSVLLVESSRFSAKLYVQTLKDLPVRTVTVENGYDALLRVLNEPFDILITSLEIPVMNGIALIGALRLSSSPNQKIKTVLLTSNADVGKKKRRAIDPDQVIFKGPDISARLRDTVKNLTLALA